MYSRIHIKKRTCYFCLSPSDLPCWHSIFQFHPFSPNLYFIHSRMKVYCVYVSYCQYLLICWWISVFVPSPSYVNITAISKDAQVSLREDAESLQNMTRSGTAESYGSTCYCLRNVCIDFHSGCYSLHCHKQLINLSFPTSSPRFVVIDVFILSILIFVCFSKMATNIGQN